MKILPNQRILETLRCPICNSPMMLTSGESSVSLLCLGARRHCYDVSSNGYVNLMPPGHTAGGDSKQAVRARTDFLNLELYRPVADALVTLLQRYAPGADRVVVDAGCGEGYYTASMANHGFFLAGVDLSRAGAEATAKRLARQGVSSAFVGVSSVFSMPFATESIDVVTNIFAPCAEKEFARVLRPDGILAVVYAGPDHLMGLKQALYDETKTNEERADLPKQMELLDEISVKLQISVFGQEHLQNLFTMTPYYWRTSPSDSEKLKQLEHLTTPVDMRIAIYRKNAVQQEEA